MTRQLLIVDDDPQVVRLLTRFFESDGWQVLVAAEGRTAIEQYNEARPDVVITDLEMPVLGGLQLLDILRQHDPDATIVVLTGHADVPTAVEAMQLGAETFLTKPIDLDHLGAAVLRAYEKARLRQRSRFLSEQSLEVPALDTLGDTPRMRHLARQIQTIASGTAPVLLTGETGTGKGWTSRLIHALSPRLRGPFVEVNCASLTATFLESELFGHERGAFTDAKTSKRGLFEVAHEGSIFLDEIGELAPELQPKILKVLESGRFRRIGGTFEHQVDVRVIAATNSDLAEAVKARRFREDLFYRLNVLPLELPPLRERGGNTIVSLAHGILKDLRDRGNKGPRRISADAMQALLSYSWPGNIRQLRNVLERVILLAQDADAVLPEHLPPELRRPSGATTLEDVPEDLSLAGAESRHIRRVLERFQGNFARAARALGIARGTLYKRAEQYGITRRGPA